MELEFKLQEWTYRTLPNKMYELVHSTGDINKHGTGYLTDAESEMITILNYLNFGEKTGITESMIAQIDQAIRDSAITSLHGEEEQIRIKPQKYMPVAEFVEQMTEVVKIPVGIVYFKDLDDDMGYTVIYHEPGKNPVSKRFRTIIESRGYLENMGCSVRMANRSEEEEVVETWI